MPVGVHRDLDAVMAKLVLHIHQALPIGQEQAGEGMSEVVKADMPEASVPKTGS
jgi:hypothetical protein